MSGEQPPEVGPHLGPRTAGALVGLAVAGWGLFGYEMVEQALGTEQVALVADTEAPQYIHPEGIVFIAGSVGGIAVGTIAGDIVARTKRHRAKARVGTSVSS